MERKTYVVVRLRCRRNSSRKTYRCRKGPAELRHHAPRCQRRRYGPRASIGIDSQT